MNIMRKILTNHVKKLEIMLAYLSLGNKEFLYETTQRKNGQNVSANKKNGRYRQNMGISQ